MARKKYYWLCRCECGSQKEIAAYRVIHGNSRSCGCIRREVKRNLAGKKFGKWTVLKHMEKRPIYCLCQCECGSEPKIVHNKLLISGESKSCGCYRLERLREAISTHKMSEKPIYRTWIAMASRCNNPNHSAYRDYGGRGIKICERWKKFENFYEDMGDKPPGMTIDRIDNDGDYSPSNCRWVTSKEQSRNKRSNVWVTFNGKTMTVADWARETGLRAEKIRYRLKAGWPTEKVLRD
jgi:hypothetical protein